MMGSQDVLKGFVSLVRLMGLMCLVGRVDLMGLLVGLVTLLPASLKKCRLGGAEVLSFE